MAWVGIKYACGHEDEIQLYGPTAERQKKLKWMEGFACAQCRLKEAKDIADSRGYPEIVKGHYKETGVVWAYEVRNEKILQIKEFMKTAKFKPEEQEIADNIVKKILDNPFAGFWIKYKDYDPLEFIQEMYREAK